MLQLQQLLEISLPRKKRNRSAAGATKGGKKMRVTGGLLVIAVTNNTIFNVRVLIMQSQITLPEH